MTTFACLPCFEESRKHWEHFWDGELYKRPVLMTSLERVPGKAADPFGEHYYRALTQRHEEQLALLDAHFENLIPLGETVPCFAPDFGPDQCAAFLGAELRFSEESKHTNWVEPIVDDWSKALPLRFDPSNPTFERFLEYVRKIAAHARGRYCVECIDMHSNADALSALRGPERFCMDFYDCPEWVERAMHDVRQVYWPMIKAVRRAARMEESGCAQYGMWHPRSFQVVQSDVICMLRPEHVRRLILPALEEEIACHERSYFHLDGPGALRHLDDILSLKFHILQWQSGAGQKPNWQWLDVLKKAQGAGKAVDVFGAGLAPDVVRQLHRELDPARVIYHVQVNSSQEFDDLARWLERNS